MTYNVGRQYEGGRLLPTDKSHGDTSTQMRFPDSNQSKQRRLLLVFAFVGVYRECFAMAPDYVGIGQLFLTALGVVGLVFVIAGAAAARNHVKGALAGGGVFIGLLAAVFVWMSITGNIYNHGIEEIVADQKAAAEQSIVALRERCDRYEQFNVKRSVKLGSSIFVNLDPDTKPPTAANAPSVVQTSAMKEQVKKYGHSFPPSSNNIQYLKPISWVAGANQPETIAELMHADLIDSRDQYKTYGKTYYRLATRQRWEKDGLSEVAIAYTEKYIDEYKFKNWPDGKLKQRVPIDRPTAQYIFIVDDVSTIDDRKDWLARGRIRLLDAASSEVVAEYIGFQSLLRANAVCPNALKLAVKPTGEWDMLRFFFARVTQQQVSQTASRGTG